jgi:hypothetical protein
MERNQESTVFILGVMLGITLSMLFWIRVSPFEEGRNQGVMLCKMNLPECEIRFRAQKLEEELNEVQKKL